MSTPQDQLINLLTYQRKDIPDTGLYGRLSFEDLKRIDMITKGDIITSNDCCLYLAKAKGNYCTFSFKGKKVSIIRLLYHNYVEDVKSTHKFRHICENPGICCNIRHLFVIDSEQFSDFEESGDEGAGKQRKDENVFKME